MLQNAALSPQQLKAIAALAEGKNQRAAAKAAGCDRSTIQRWLLESHFRDELQWAKQQIYEQVISKLLNASDQAIEVLVEVAQDKQQSGSARVSAARSILEIATKNVLADDLNHALTVVRRYGFLIVDSYRREENGSDS